MSRKKLSEAQSRKKLNNDETDEMKLKLLENTGPLDPATLFPAELNKHFIAQIKTLTEENNDLRIIIQTKDKEISELSKTVINLNQRIRDIISNTGATISTKSAGIISAKISELCKQNRHLVAELESAKTKCSVFERKLMRKETQLQEKELEDACKCSRAPPNKDELDEIESLKQQLAALMKKFTDCKEKNTVLKNEMLMANKVFQQEMGKEYTSWKDLVCEKSGWKGRAQQIVLLNAKISDLEDKLNIKSRSLVEERKKENQAQHFRDLENKKKREIEESLKQLNQLKEDYGDVKRKLDGARARIRLLECDCTTLRQKLTAFADKSSHDDTLVKEQRKELRTLELHYQELLQGQQIKIDKLRIEKEEAQKELSHTFDKIDAFQKQVFDKASKIENLRNQLTRFEESSLQTVFFTPLKSARDVEIKKLSEMIITLNQRLSEERKRVDECYATIRNMRLKKKQVKKEMDKLRQLNDLLSRKKKSHPTFKDIPSLGSKASLASKESVSLDRKASSQTASAVSLVGPPGDISESAEMALLLEKEALSYRLEIADEKLKLMEDRVRMLEEEKDSDFKHLTGMLQTSKELFMEALAVLHKQKCNCSTEICNCN